MEARVYRLPPRVSACRQSSPVEQIPVVTPPPPPLLVVSRDADQQTGQTGFFSPKPSPPPLMCALSGPCLPGNIWTYLISGIFWRHWKNLSQVSKFPTQIHKSLDQFFEVGQGNFGAPTLDWLNDKIEIRRGPWADNRTVRSVFQVCRRPTWRRGWRFRNKEIRTPSVGSGCWKYILSSNTGYIPHLLSPLHQVIYIYVLGLWEETYTDTGRPV